MSTPLLWSIPVRLIHWSLAICITLNLFLLETGEDAHRYLGYAAVAIVVIRTFLGIRSSGAEGFRSFPLGVSQMRGFLKNKLTDKTQVLRHNPLASWVYVFLWLSVVALGVTGWLMGLDYFWGNQLLEEIHSYVSDFVKALVVFHLTGILIDSLRYRRHTWLAMFTGHKGQFFRKAPMQTISIPATFMRVTSREFLYHFLSY